MLKQKHAYLFDVERECIEYCTRIYFLEQQIFVLVYRKDHIRDCDFFSINAEIKLKGAKMVSFFEENLLIFSDANKINYVALDNIDRLVNPGEVVVEFQMVRNEIAYIVRALIYDSQSKPFAITVHKLGDTTDCDKISFPSKDIHLQDAKLVKFLSENLLIWLKPDMPRRISNIGL